MYSHGPGTSPLLAILFFSSLYCFTHYVDRSLLSFLSFFSSLSLFCPLPALALFSWVLTFDVGLVSVSVPAFFCVLLILLSLSLVLICHSSLSNAYDDDDDECIYSALQSLCIWSWALTIDFGVPFIGKSDAYNTETETLGSLIAIHTQTGNVNHI